MTKRDLINLLENSGPPDNAPVKIDLSLYDEHDYLKDAVEVAETSIVDNELWLIAADERSPYEMIFRNKNSD